MKSMCFNKQTSRELRHFVDKLLTEDFTIPLPSRRIDNRTFFKIKILNNPFKNDGRITKIIN